MTPTQFEQLKTLVKLGEKATPGEWFHVSDNRFLSAKPHWIASDRQHELMTAAYERARDLEFVMHAANARPILAALLAAHEAQEAQAAVMREALEKIAGGNLGPQPWQANYERVKEVAAAALASDLGTSILRELTLMRNTLEEIGAQKVTHIPGRTEYMMPFYGPDGEVAERLSIQDWIEKRKKWARELTALRAVRDAAKEYVQSAGPEAREDDVIAMLGGELSPLMALERALAAQEPTPGENNKT